SSAVAKRSFELVATKPQALTNWRNSGLFSPGITTSSDEEWRLPAAPTSCGCASCLGVKRLKRQLDQVYADNCATTKQRQQLAKSIRDPMRARSQRPPPEGAPDWALKPAPSSPTGASASGARR
uniref:DUF4187 domain-containing protein n=1 Tax=Macrostomum lignano TaxID=282301 RepID=A0A1I8F3K4_9PLAT